MVGGMFRADTMLSLHTNSSTRHLMTGLGAYMYLVWGIWLRHCLNNRQEEYHLWWPRFWNIPEVLRTSAPGKGANGVAKKSN